MEEYICQRIPIFYYDALNTQARSCYMLIKILNIDVEVEDVNFVQYENLSENFKGMSAFYTVPTLIDGNITLCHGQTIMMYLCQKYSHPIFRNLFPQDYISRIKIMSVFFYEGYYLYRYLGHLLADIYLNQYTNFDADYHSQKVANAYNTLNNFLNDHSYMISNSLTIADISVISTVAALNIIFPIDNDRYPNLFDWFERLKKMDFYQYNEEGIYKQRYFLATVGKCPFPTSNNSERRQSRKSNQTCGCGLKVLDVMPNKGKEKLNMNGGAYENNECFSDDSIFNSERVPTNTTIQLQQVTCECKSLSNDSELDNVRRNSNNNGTKNGCFHCSCYISSSNFEIPYIDGINNGNKQNGSNKDDFSKNPDFDYSFYPNCCNSCGMKQVFKKLNCTCCQQKPFLEYQNNAELEENYNKKSFIESNNDNRRGTETGRHRDKRRSSYGVNNAVTCSNPRVEPAENERDISEKVLHVVVEKLKQHKKEGQKCCRRNSTARKREFSENMEGKKYCSCAGIIPPDQTYRCLCSFKNQQKDECPPPSSQLKTSIVPCNEVESNSFSKNFRFCDCAEDGIPDQRYRCSCPLKSKGDDDECASPQIRQRQQSLANSSLAHENDMEDKENENVTKNTACPCQRNAVDSKRHTATRSSHQQPKEYNSSSSTASASPQKNCEKTNENQTIATREENVAITELTEDDDAVGKVKRNTIFECDASTCPKLVTNLLVLNPDKLNQNEKSACPSSSDLNKESETADSKKQSVTNNRLQAGSNFPRKSNTKLTNTSCQSIVEFRELRPMKSYLLNKNDKVTKVIYHVCMKKDIKNQRICSDCMKVAQGKISKSKIPRLVSNYENNRYFKLTRDVKCNCCNQKSFCKKYF